MIFDDVRNLVRAMLHALRAGGAAGLGEGGALFVTAAVALALGSVVRAAVMLVQRRWGGRAGPEVQGRPAEPVASLAERRPP